MRPYMLTFIGLPGTGKSTVAAALGRALNVPVLSSDTVRRELGLDVPDPAALDAEMFRRARTLLGTGSSFILDVDALGVLSKALAFVAEYAADLHLVHVTAPADVATARIRARMEAVRADPAASHSRATVDKYVERAALHASSQLPAVLGTVDTTRSLPGQVDAIVARLLAARS